VTEGNSCPDLVFLKIMYIVYDAYLSQLRDDGGDMVVEPIHSLSILSTIAQRYYSEAQLKQTQHVNQLGGQTMLQ
jgi:hypothetical protein